MRVIVQRCNKANVEIKNQIYNQIDQGLVLLVGFTHDDNIKDIDYCVRKIINLRIFDDEAGVMNKSILDTYGSILSISQFTLYGDIKKGNRPSYLNALSGNKATDFYDEFNNKLNMFVETKTGIFGADMKINLTNDGPVTIIIDSKV